MSIKQKLTSQKNWKAKMRLALLVPLLVVVIYIVAQSGTVDFSSITGFAVLGAKSDDNLPEVLNVAVEENNTDDESLDNYPLYLEDSEDEDIEENVDEPAENESDVNETVQVSPIILSGGSGGGSSGSSGDDNPPAVENPPVDDPEDNISNTAPVIPANFWGQFNIGGNLSGTGETITAKIKTLEYNTNLQDEGYYTITVPGSEGDIIEFFYNGTLVGNSSWTQGKIERVDLYFY